MEELLYNNSSIEEIKQFIINNKDNETDNLLPELLDEVRDKIVEKTGQNIDW